MISRLISVLQQAGLIISDEELASLSDAESLLNDEDIADAIWLALKMASRDELEENEVVEVQPEHSSSTVTIKTDDSKITDSSHPPVSAYIPEPSSQGSTNTPKVVTPEQGVSIQVKAAPALQDARSIARSLHPLRRRVPSLTQCILDEVETVNRIAECNVWVPVLKPALERWLDLELVIESSQFSFIWQSTLDEFQQILERQGAFRNVRTWRVQGVDDGQLHLVPKQQTLTEQTQFHSPKELIGAPGRRLVLYVSDCRSPVWQQGTIHSWLKLWSQHGSTAIVQLLPERLWEQSELDVGLGIQVSALMPGVPNHKLVVKERRVHLDVKPAQALTLPVVTLTTRSLQQLALVVSAAGNQRVPARLFDLSWVTASERDRSPSVIRPQTAQERVELFVATASPIAQRLARMMAAVPVSLPVIHLIQERLLKDSNPVHVAEVYSSSLLKPVQQNSSIGEPVRYDFFPGVRQLLNECTPEDETLNVLQELSEEIANTLGLPIRSFTALLSPKSELPQETRKAILPFAKVATQVLHNLGGEFASLARMVERDADLETLRMKIDLRRFFQACNPAKTLMMGNPEDRKYYIDFSSVRGGEIISQMERTITYLSPEPTCQLFTGHIGCGKSTELLRLQAELERERFHVVYFASSQDLDMGDVDVSDILLAITRQVSDSLKDVNIKLQPGYFTKLLQESIEFLKTPVELDVQAELSLGIAKLTAKTKESPKLRSQLRQYLEPQTSSILNAINEEILGRATEELRWQGKKGLVVIVDNLDRVDNRRRESGRTQPEYLFLDRGEQLSRLHCHVVYTIPLVLMFSKELEALKNRLGGGTSPKVLPMVPVKLRDGSDSAEGLTLLRQMVLARAFPDLPAEQRINFITDIFDSPETLDRLCRASGGHVRNLLGLLFSCIQRHKQLPLSRDTLESVIREQRIELSLVIDQQEWELLRQVAKTKKLNGEERYQPLLRSLFVFEYRHAVDGPWFDINPLLAEAPEVRS